MAKVTFTVEISENMIKAEATKEAKAYVKEVLSKEFDTFIKERKVRIESAIDSAIREEARLLLKTDTKLISMITESIKSMKTEEILAYIETKGLEARIEKKIEEAISKLMKLKG